jgi:hypothetical protein
MNKAISELSKNNKRKKLNPIKRTHLKDEANGSNCSRNGVC